MKTKGHDSDASSVGIYACLWSAGHVIFLSCSLHFFPDHYVINSSAKSLRVAALEIN